MLTGVQSCNLRLVNVISIMFNIIPKPEYATFHIFERKKAAKGETCKLFIKLQQCALTF